MSRGKARTARSVKAVGSRQSAVGSRPRRSRCRRPAQPCGLPDWLGEIPWRTGTKLSKTGDAGFVVFVVVSALGSQWLSGRLARGRGRRAIERVFRGCPGISRSSRSAQSSL
jgi:hypothetical protein